MKNWSSATTFFVIFHYCILRSSTMLQRKSQIDKCLVTGWHRLAEQLVKLLTCDDVTPDVHDLFQQVVFCCVKPLAWFHTCFSCFLSLSLLLPILQNYVSHCTSNYHRSLVHKLGTNASDREIVRQQLLALPTAKEWYTVLYFFRLISSQFLFSFFQSNG